MFRTSNSSSSGRLVHAVLWFYDTVSSTSCNRPDCLYGCMKEIPRGCSKHVEDTIIKLKYKSQRRAFCWFLLHRVQQKRNSVISREIFKFVFLSGVSIVFADVRRKKPTCATAIKFTSFFYFQSSKIYVFGLCVCVCVCVCRRCWVRGWGCPLFFST
jgi:hypothetical protein